MGGFGNAEWFPLSVLSSWVLLLPWHSGDVEEKLRRFWEHSWCPTSHGTMGCFEREGDINPIPFPCQGLLPCPGMLSQLRVSRSSPGAAKPLAAVARSHLGTQTPCATPTPQSPWAQIWAFCPREQNLILPADDGRETSCSRDQNPLLGTPLPWNSQGASSSARCCWAVSDARGREWLRSRGNSLWGCSRGGGGLTPGAGLVPAEFCRNGGSVLRERGRAACPSRDTAGQIATGCCSSHAGDPAAAQTSLLSEVFCKTPEFC